MFEDIVGQFMVQLVPVLVSTIHCVIFFRSLTDCIVWCLIYIDGGGSKGV